MKIMYFDDYQLGVVKEDRVVNVMAALGPLAQKEPQERMKALILHFDTLRPQLEKAAAQGPGIPLSEVRIRPPLPHPATIDCMAVNYMEDGTRTSPAPINAFHKAPGAIIGHGDTM
ncbi:MAG: fumarylacetoacetate hydrolase, partial [Betaproteobacteria bacterium]